MTEDVPDWREYERTAFEYLQVNYNDADVLHNVSLPGRLSGILRQVDILVRESLRGEVFTTAFEAKHYKRRIDVKGVEEAIGLFRDLGVDRGVMITTVGYSDGALRRANADDVDVELDILNLASLTPLQSDAGALPYAGESGATISVPLGWIIDGAKSPWGSARLYRRGLSFDEAYAEPEFMYVQFWEKNEVASSAEQLAQIQNEGIWRSFPHAKITIEELDFGEGKKGYIRTAENAYDWLEITGSVEYEEFILFIVLHCREIVAKRNRRKLKYVLHKALPFSVRHKVRR